MDKTNTQFANGRNRIPARRVLGIVVGAALLAGVASGPTLAQPIPDPSKDAPTNAQEANFTTLNGTWDFALAATERDVEKLADFYKPNHDLSAFKPMRVPSNWVMQGYDKPQYDHWKDSNWAPEGFYVRNFDVPRDWRERRVLLHFGGVWESAEVWLNGQRLGRNDTGFNKITFDITSSMKPGARNVLAVRVRQVVPNYKLDTNDDWALGGIYRDVTLETMPRQVWLDQVQVQTKFDQYYRDADLTVRVMVGDHRKTKESWIVMNQGEAPYVLRLSLIDAKGRLVQSQDTTVPPHYGTAGESTLAMHVQKPLQWNAETPNLYTLNVDLVENGKTLHSRSVKVGFREISTAGGVLRVNGQAVKLRGADRHDQSPEVGRATTREHWLKDLTLMKAGNINFLRLAHYPHAEGFLALCDEMGMYVTDEVPMGFGGDALNDHPEASGAILERTYRTVERDINHPSVIIWSVGNEDPLSTLHMASVRMIKGLDSTRPVLLPLRAEATLPKEIEIRAPHYWTARMYDDEAAHSDRPIVTTEFSHAFGNEGFGGLQDRWKALTRHPAGAGGAMWLWADQGLMTDKRKADGSYERVLDVPDAGFDGIVDSMRNPTRDYWEAKAVYAQVYPTIESIDVAPGQASVRIPIQNDFDFTNLDTVRITWQLMEDDHSLAAGTTSLRGVPHAAQPLDLPLAALKKIKPGATYHVWLGFLRADGSEIGRRTVELRSTQVPEATAMAAPVQLDKQDGKIAARVGDSTYVFDTQTGQLSSASYRGATRISDVKPTIWRALNHTEMLKQKDDFVDLNKFTPTVNSFKVDTSNGKVSIHADVNYVVDAKNSFAVAYDYDVNPTGKLDVRYSVMPKVQAKWLPHVGMDMQTSKDLGNMRWMGLGPMNAYPNMKTASILGVYSIKLSDTSEDAMKAIRWVDLTGDAGAAVRLKFHGYLSYRQAEPGHVLVLSSVVGRPNKRERAEEPEDRLDTDIGKPFVGAFSVDLAAPSQ